MEEKFSVPFEEHKLIGDNLSCSGEKPDILFLHGAGKAERARYRPIREFLLLNGISSCAFDMIGHGDTGGDLLSSSLEQRTAQALAVIRDQELRQPLAFFGASMGAYTAVKISETFPVKTMILLVPAVYDKETYRLQFGIPFSKGIRMTRSWQGTDAWNVLAGYTGKLLIIAAEKDRTVPRELSQKIYDSAKKAERRELYFVPRAPHLLMTHLSENSRELQVVLDKILNFML